jgi:hypothetical protein
VSLSVGAGGAAGLVLASTLTVTLSGAAPARALSSTAAVPAAAQPERVSFGIGPASATGPDHRSDLDYTVTPGVDALDHVAVANYSLIPLRLQLYATDAAETQSGNFGLLPAGDRPTQVGSWISLPAGVSTIAVPAESRARPGIVVIPFSIRIPASASPGDHAGGIVVSLQTVGRNATGQDITLDQRVGVRVYVDVAGPVRAALAIEDLHAGYEGRLDPIGSGRVRVTYRIANTGNVVLGVSQSVKVAGWLGSSASVRAPAITLLLPGASVPETVVVKGMQPEVDETAKVDARSHPVAGLSSAGGVRTSASKGFWAIPWTLIVCVLLVVALVLVWLRRRRRHRATAPEPEAPPLESVEVGA